MASSWDVLSRILMQCYLQPYDERHRDPAVPGRALAAATKSVELDPMYAAGRAAYGWTLRWTGQHETALQELRTAIELTPNDSSVQAMNADALSLAGYHDESIEAWERAARLDPFVSPINQALRAWAHLLLDDFEGAIALTRSCLSRARHLLVCNLWHAAAAQRLGLHAEVVRAVRGVAEANPAFTVSDWLSFVDWARQEDSEKARRIFLAAGLPE